MKHFAATCLVAALAMPAFAQETVTSLKATAKAAAGTDLMGIYSVICPPDTPPPARGAGRGAAGAGRAAGGRRDRDPPKEEWFTGPVKVFDNLYFVGTKVHGSWAITTSDGIIVLDALYGYAAPSEIGDGLKTLGLDPTKIKYVIVSHGHGDHSGGAKYLQDTFHPHLILSAADWDLLARDTRNPGPKRDMIATDGEKLTLGDTTITLYLTPGHTEGTISTVIPVKDHGQPHVAVEWGGTAIYTTTPIPQLEEYVKSANRFSDIVAGSGADVIITNHTAFDHTLDKLDALAKRKASDPNPYVVGKETVKRYMEVVDACGKAMLLTAQTAH